nr:hypothetical protein CFP56_69354 [Quercus suber]
MTVAIEPQVTFGTPSRARIGRHVTNSTSRYFLNNKVRQLRKTRSHQIVKARSLETAYHTGLASLSFEATLDIVVRVELRLTNLDELLSSGCFCYASQDRCKSSLHIRHSMVAVLMMVLEGSGISLRKPLGEELLEARAEAIREEFRRTSARLAATV